MYALSTYRLSGRPFRWLAAALVLCAGIAPTAASAAPGRADGTSARQVQGWNAGPVELGSGYHAVGGSDRVSEVQRRLGRLGYSPGPVDGLFGPRTDDAVRRYQSDRELTADGIVGNQTLGSLRARTGTASDRKPAQRSAPSRPATGTASSPARPKIGDSASDTEGLAGLPAWWVLVLLVPLGFSAAVISALFLVRGPGIARGWGLGLWHRFRRRPAADPAAAAPAGAVYVEGHSHDPRVGRFGGFAYWMWPVADAGTDRDEPTLLVYDAAKPAPVSARMDEITTVNGQAVSAAIPGADRLRRPRVRWVGAQVHLADANGVESLPGTLPVELELFAEGEFERWETGVVTRGRPLHVRLDDLERGVDRAVKADLLPELARALQRGGLRMSVEELSALPFAVERTVDVEFALAQREVTRAEAG